MGGQVTADGGRVGICPRAANLMAPIMAGATSWNPADERWRTSGMVRSRCNFSWRRSIRHIGRLFLPSECLRRLRYDRKRLGMDGRLLDGPAHDDAAKPLLRSGQSEDQRRRAELRPATGGNSHSSERCRKADLTSAHRSIRAWRYRPKPARHPEMIDSATTHVGFRCVVRA